MYFRNCHNVLARLNGFGEAHITNDLRNNSTINWSGRAKHNIEIDLANELLNKVFKEFLLSTGGNYSLKAIQRRSQCLRLFEEVHAELEAAGNEDESYHGTHSKDYRKDRSDLDKGIRMILEDRLLEDMGKRCHEGFEEFKFSHYFVDNIVDLKKRIEEESKMLDSAERYMNEYRSSAAPKK